MSAQGMMATILATQLAEACRKDDSPEGEGCDISAGIFGPHVSQWLRDVAAVVVAIQRAPSTPAAPQAPAGQFRAVLRSEIDKQIDASGDVARQEAQIDMADHLLVKFNELFPEA